MAQFDLNQPIVSWKKGIVQEYDGPVKVYGLVCGDHSDQDIEKHADVGHGGARADGQGEGADHGDFAGNAGAGSDADGDGAGGAGANVNGGGLDLNQIANIRRRTQYTDDECRAIYRMLLKKNGGDTMKRGVSKAVSAEMRVPLRVVQRIWLKGRRGGGIDAVVSKKAKNCGRKRIELDLDAIRELPTNRRMTIQELAVALRMKKSTVFRRLKEGTLRRPGK